MAVVAITAEDRTIDLTPIDRTISLGPFNVPQNDYVVAMNDHLTILEPQKYTVQVKFSIACETIYPVTYNIYPRIITNVGLTSNRIILGTVNAPEGIFRRRSKLIAANYIQRASYEAPSSHGGSVILQSANSGNERYNMRLRFRTGSYTRPVTQRITIKDITIVVYPL